MGKESTGEGRGGKIILQPVSTQTQAIVKFKPCLPHPYPIRLSRLRKLLAIGAV